MFSMPETTGNISFKLHSEQQSYSKLWMALDKMSYGDKSRLSQGPYWLVTQGTACYC